MLAYLLTTFSSTDTDCHVHNAACACCRQLNMARRFAGLTPSHWRFQAKEETQECPIFPVTVVVCQLRSNQQQDMATVVLHSVLDTGFSLQDTTVWLQIGKGKSWVKRCRDPETDVWYARHAALRMSGVEVGVSICDARRSEVLHVLHSSAETVLPPGIMSSLFLPIPRAEASEDTHPLAQDGAALTMCFLGRWTGLLLIVPGQVI